MYKEIFVILCFNSYSEIMPHTLRNMKIAINTNLLSERILGSSLKQTTVWIKVCLPGLFTKHFLQIQLEYGG